MGSVVRLLVVAARRWAQTHRIDLRGVVRMEGGTNLTDFMRIVRPKFPFLVDSVAWLDAHFGKEHPLVALISPSGTIQAVLVRQRPVQGNLNQEADLGRVLALWDGLIEGHDE